MKVFLINFLGPEILLILFFLGLIIPALLYLNTIHKTLDEVRDEYRLIPSRSPMLTLVPIVGNFMLFLVAIKLSQSLELEFEGRGIATDGKDFGKKVGLIMSTASLLVLLTLIMGFAGLSIVVLLLPWIRILVLIGLVCWIIHWTKVSAYRKKLLANPVKLV